MKISLHNKTAIVTGASRGIGRSIAVELANAGAKVMLVSRSESALQEVAESFGNGSSVKFIAADISIADSFNEVVKHTISEFGSVDILVNNAGITRDNLIMRLKEDDWNTVIDINLKGTFNGIKSVTRPMMKARCGRIINITSVVGQIGNAGQANYAASKAGIIGLTMAAAKELGSRNITVNGIAPGYISTDMTENLSEDVKTQLKNNIPLGRLGKPEDVANMVVFLASDEAAYITGQTFNVDGGMVMN